MRQCAGLTLFDLICILKTNTPLPLLREKMLVRELLDVRIKLLHKDVEFNYTELNVKPINKELVILCE